MYENIIKLNLESFELMIYLNLDSTVHQHLE